MSIYSVGSTLASATTQQQTTSQSSVASTSLSENMDTFLTLLIAQLQHQDPLDPTDTNEFTQQLVQYSQVEQSIQTNTHLETLLEATNQNMATQAISYMGKTIQADSNYLSLQDGYSEFTYTLDNTADTCVVAISDLDGKIVASFNGNTAAGSYPVEWDGTDSQGNQLADGAYLINITALAKGEPVNVTTTAYGKVTDVASDGENIALGMGDVIVYLSQVMSVHENRTSSIVDTEDSGTIPASK